MVEQRLKTGLVGAGVFAGYHASKIHASEITDFAGVHDRHAERSRALVTKYGGRVFDDLNDVLEASEAVIVASPAPSHYEIGMRALEAGCHLLMEKPLALSANEAMEIVELAESKGLVLQVGHQERLVCRALGLFDISEVPVSIEIVRAGPAPQQGRAMDISVIWDLMIHDIDLVHALVSGEVSAPNCTGRAELGEYLDFAEAQYLVGATQVKTMASRIAPERSRHMTLTFEKGQIVLDFLSRQITNTTPHKVVADLSANVPDPLGQADEMFFAACSGYGAPLVTGREAAIGVATAEILSALATGSAVKP